MSVCHKCGRVNGERYKFCLGCGVPLNAEPDPAPSPAPTPVAAPKPAVRQPESKPEPVPSRGSLKASDTVPGVRHADPPDEALGMARTVAREPTPPPHAPSPPPGIKFCTNCGGEVPIDFAFCGRCGTRLQVPQAPEPPSVSTADGHPDPNTTLSDAVSESDVLLVLEEEPPVITLDQPKGNASPVRGKLILIHPDGSEGDAIVLVDGDNILGRVSSPAVLAEDIFVSPEHLKVQCSDGHVLFDDLDSLNGTFLRVVGNPIVLEHGDIIRIGQQVLRFELLSHKRAIVKGDGTEVIGSPAGELWGTLHRVIGVGVESHVYPLQGEETRIGREVGDITFRGDGFVSGRHARIRREEGRVLLEDLGSSNGTYIKLRNIYAAQPRDLFLLGRQLFRLDMRA